jgi:hypothetical protein
MQSKLFYEIPSLVKAVFCLGRSFVYQQYKIPGWFYSHLSICYEVASSNFDSLSTWEVLGQGEMNKAGTIPHLKF